MKAEEMKQILKGLKENQVPKEKLDALESFRTLGGKRKKSFMDEKSVQDEVLNDNEKKEDNIEEEKEDKVEEEKPVNIFQMKFYENKKVKTEEKKEEKKKTEEDIEWELREQVIQEEMTLNLSINPFKPLKPYIEEDPDEEDKEVEGSIETQDQDLKVFVQEMSAKHNQPIDRTEEETKQREKLPIFLREHDIIEAVNQNLITIISGETGSGILDKILDNTLGKSTQVPQFLYERGYGNPNGPNPGKIGVLFLDSFLN